MFSVENLTAGYSENSIAVKSFSLVIEEGQVLCLLGRNGAGKTSTLKAIMGLMPWRNGGIKLGATEIDTLQPHEISRVGVGYVPQGRRLFAELTVRENLEIGLLASGGKYESLEQPLIMFPRLSERLDQVAGTLSGGEQQMLAMARALCVNPSLLLLDEPTEGLMPSMISAIRDVIAELAGTGVSILLVEQRIDAVLPVADQVAFMENGELREILEVAELGKDHELVKRYVGVS